MNFSHSKGLIAAVSLLLAGSFLVTGAAPTSVAAQSSPADNLAHTITVVGRGEVTAQPDIATSNIGVDVTSATVVDAMADANDRMAEILKAVKALGIADRDIQTSHFSISFEQRSAEPLPASTASSSAVDTSSQSAGVYHVSNMLQVTIRDLDKVGAVLDAAVEAGANNIWGVSFSLDDTSTLEAEARESAVADARSRAEALAKLNGVSVGEVVAISEVIGNTGSVVMYDAMSAKSFGGGTAIEQGEVTFSTQIQVVYAIE